ncbi:IMS domain-containing protein [Laspinema olomoucense]|uniref:IMS domain-containing protein n=1 Tax=Laspinema olomoucense D3b TaxID=2953688 RepID=A0ABT2N9E0_9CYAN|nr:MULTISPECIES: IMS domain-containing protein [unclassified Laspinema]MCT7978005.1 IMS domain-containing protein [Laspinema sp. D3b]MCT7987088.1 IMS domain-containing protein [Laspinema sp. D3a]MCT7994218.1 IMS domain-containing protein [Laspinema sp. D3c]
MLVPLDYYRILGLPIQVPGVETPGYAEQLKQAHRDRKEQLPRREYSEVATSARRQLIDEAYAVLSDPEERQKYDASFLAKAYQLESPGADSSTGTGGVEASDSYLDPHTPNIDIPSEGFIGSLLILQELGEYELVLKLGLPILSGSNSSLKNGRFGDPKLVEADIILTLALACLELGREQWQGGKYENAAISLENGQEMLLREGLFPAVRGEMQADLYKLRPYRILELLALPETRGKERQRGLQLLQDMLQERGGIDGTGDDRSGLSVDDFLRFIQQLRSHLTAAEQQDLFEAEARRPSAVATYLAVYALVARGFAARQPALIRRGQMLLTHLGRRQDVHLEQSVCSLLLGQTEDAAQSLELTQEQETLTFIQENSRNSPDLLPGLCLYAERWLQSEVFPHFRDLATAQASLKDYFADEQVQAYLEALPETTADEVNEWMVVPPPPNPVTIGLPQPTPRRDTAFMTTLRLDSNGASNGTPGKNPSLSSSVVSLATLPTAIRTSSNPDTAGPGRIRDRTRPSEDRSASGNGKRDDRSKLPIAARVRGLEPIETPPSRRSGVGRTGAKGKNPKLERWILLGVGGLLGLLLLWLLINSLRWVAGLFQGGPSLQGEQLSIQLDQSAIPISTQPTPEELGATGPLNEAIAQGVLQKWFTIKSEALGSTHQVQKLPEILMDPALSLWQRRAEAARGENWYWEYDHNIQETGFEMSPTDPNRATVEAQVSETARLFENGQLSSTRDDNLRVQYQLVREDGQWRIRDWVILP